MADKTGIEWTEATWNPVVGCSVVSPGCTNCYAMSQAARIQRMTPGSHYLGTTKPTKAGPVWTGTMKLAPDHIITQPLRWRKPRTIFVNSMSDLFHENAPDEWIDRVFAVMALCPQHTFQVLTKRPGRMRQYIEGLGNSDLIEKLRRAWRRNAVADAMFDYAGSTGAKGQRLFPTQDDPKWPLASVWLGVSAEDQKRADERIPDLLDTPAAVRFISAEPLLGPIDLGKVEAKARGVLAEGTFSYPKRIDALTGCTGHYFGDPQGDHTLNIDSHRLPRLDWVITGGESGPKARPAHPQWFRDIRDQCAAAGVAHFHKQNGEWVSVSEVEGEGEHYRFPDGATVRRVGKKLAGATIDGREHRGMPEVRHG